MELGENASVAVLMIELPVAIKSYRACYKIETRLANDVHIAHH